MMREGVYAARTVMRKRGLPKGASRPRCPASEAFLADFNDGTMTWILIKSAKIRGCEGWAGKE